VKATRWVTHLKKFEKCDKLWADFARLFEPLEKNIDFWLFQMPPSMAPNKKRAIEKFVKKHELGEKFALEPRNDAWFSGKNLEWAKDLGITWVSVDAPVFPRDVFRTSDFVYLRCHGRTGWYSHKYSLKELREIAGKIKKQKPKAAYVFFNNDHAMLGNARAMMKLL
jgi:uncharacterized protein YecE (DUF72 family)